MGHAIALGRSAKLFVGTFREHHRDV